MHIDAGARGWLLATAKNNYWRIASWYDLDDLIQDGFLVWYKVVNHYAWRPRGRAHIMALFKTAYVNHIHDLSKHRSRLHEQPISVLIDGWTMDDLDQFLPPEDGIETSVANAPPMLQPLLRQLFECDPRKLRSLYRWRGSKRETTNERFCRLVGYNPSDINLVGLLYDYLQGATHGNG